MEPIVRTGVRESGGEHLADGHIGGNVRQNGDNHDEPVHTGTGGHFFGTASHGEAEEGLGNTGIIEGSNQNELTNEKHKKTVIDFGKSGLGFGDKLFFFGLDLVSVHVVSLLGWKGVSSADERKG